MHNWFLIALIAPILWSIVSHIDKYVLSSFVEGRGVGVILIFSCLSSLIVLPAVLPFYHSEIFNVTFQDFFIMLFVGLLAAGAFYFYLKAMDEEEASIVVPFFQLIPVFGYFLSYFILDEKLNANQIFPCLLILLGIIILSMEIDHRNKISFKKRIIIYLVVSSFLFALHDTLFKKVAITQSFWVTVFWQYFSITIFGILLLIFFKKFRNDFKMMMRGVKIKFLSLNLLSEVLYIVGNLAHNFATLLAPVVLVLVISSFQPLFVFIGGAFLTLFFSSISKEKITRKDIIQKSVSILLIMIGCYFLYTV